MDEIMVLWEDNGKRHWCSKTVLELKQMNYSLIVVTKVVEYEEYESHELEVIIVDLFF